MLKGQLACQFEWEIEMRLKADSKTATKRQTKNDKRIQNKMNEMHSRYLSRVLGEHCRAWEDEGKVWHGEVMVNKNKLQWAKRCINESERKKSFSGFFALCFFFVLNLRWISDDCQDMWLWLNPSRQRERFRKDSAAASGKSSVVRVARTKLSGKGSIIQHDDMLPFVAMCCQHVGQWDDSQEFSGHLCITIDGFWLLISIFVHEKQHGYMWLNYSAI